MNMQLMCLKYSNMSFFQILTLISTLMLLLTNKAAYGACNAFEWKCFYGQCIDRDYLCDGKVNCNDGSDEIAASCKGIPCFPFAFRCTYGACIPGNGECNGKKDCADNSDESPETCAKYK